MKNEEFYNQVQAPKKDRQRPRFRSYWPMCINRKFSCNFLAPVVSQYNRSALSYQDYYHALRICTPIVLVLNIILSWFIDIRPYFDKRKGIFWRGFFTITGKESNFCRKCIIIKPSIDHTIRVGRKFHYSVQVGDRIFLERSYLGDIVKIERISGYKERILGSINRSLLRKN